MKFIIYHGWGSDSSSNWFPWLKQKLEQKGHKVHCQNMPNTQNPIQQEWIDEAMKIGIDEDTILIGHSLGTILIQRLLEKIKIKSTYLISAFDEHLGIDELKNFFEEKFDYDKIKSNTGKIVMLSSDNDPYIDIEIAKRLSQKLDCGLIIFEGMEHLSAGTGNFQFPELLRLIENDT